MVNTELVPHVTPGWLDSFANEVVPLLQERGVFRAEYDDTTARAPRGGAPRVRIRPAS